MSMVSVSDYSEYTPSSSSSVVKGLWDSRLRPQRAVSVDNAISYPSTYSVSHSPSSAEKPRMHQTQERHQSSLSYTTDATSHSYHLQLEPSRQDCCKVDCKHKTLSPVKLSFLSPTKSKSNNASSESSFLRTSETQQYLHSKQGDKAYYFTAATSAVSGNSNNTTVNNNNIQHLYNNNNGNRTTHGNEVVRNGMWLSSPRRAKSTCTSDNHTRCSQPFVTTPVSRSYFFTSSPNTKSVTQECNSTNTRSNNSNNNNCTSNNNNSNNRLNTLLMAEHEEHTSASHVSRNTLHRGEKLQYQEEQYELLRWEEEEEQEEELESELEEESLEVRHLRRNSRRQANGLTDSPTPKLQRNEHYYVSELHHLEEEKEEYLEEEEEEELQQEQLERRGELQHELENYNVTFAANHTPRDHLFSNTQEKCNATLTNKFTVNNNNINYENNEEDDDEDKEEEKEKKFRIESRKSCDKEIYIKGKLNVENVNVDMNNVNNSNNDNDNQEEIVTISSKSNCMQNCDSERRNVFTERKEVEGNSNLCTKQPKCIFIDDNDDNYDDDDDDDDDDGNQNKGKLEMKDQNEKPNWTVNQVEIPTLSLKSQQTRTSDVSSTFSVSLVNNSSKDNNRMTNMYNTNNNNNNSNKNILEHIKMHQLQQQEHHHQIISMCRLHAPHSSVQKRGINRITTATNIRTNIDGSNNNKNKNNINNNNNIINIDRTNISLSSHSPSFSFKRTSLSTRTPEAALHNNSSVSPSAARLRHREAQEEEQQEEDEERQAVSSSTADDMHRIATNAAAVVPATLNRNDKVKRNNMCNRNDENTQHAIAAVTTTTTSTTIGNNTQSNLSHSPLAKSLFRNFLLHELTEHDVHPAITVVLDLDETLVSNRCSGNSCAVLRPYCLHFLHALRHMKNIEIVLWTASTKETALPVVKQLERGAGIFNEVIFRNSMWFTEPVHTKDLRLLGRPLDRVVIIDNSANCCKLHPRNSILIEEFHGRCSTEDAALVNVYYMIEALLKIINSNDNNSTSNNTNVGVRAGLQKLNNDGHLCHSVVFTLPDSWKILPLSEIAPLKIPPRGKFVRANTLPPSKSIMKYWTYETSATQQSERE